MSVKLKKIKNDTIKMLKLVQNDPVTLILKEKRNLILEVPVEELKVQKVQNM